MKQRAKHIEFFGLCGVGKSTVINALKPLMATQSTHRWTTPIVVSRRQTRWALLRYCFRLCLQRPRIISAIVFDASFRDFCRKIAYRLAGLRRYAHSESYWFFHENGVFQPLIDYTIRKNFNCFRHLSAVLKTLPRPGKVVYIFSNEALALKRFCMRESRTTDTPQLLENFSRAALLCKMLEDYFVASGIPLIAFSTNESPSSEKLAALHQQML